MNSFIEDYLQSPSSAIASARERSKCLSWASDVDEEMIYDTLSSGQFRLYEAIIFSLPADDLLKRDSIRPVA